jgi:hypothetical protein
MTARILLLATVAVLATAGAALAREQIDAPEIDPSIATGALTLLVTGLLVLTGKTRKA